MKVQAGDLPLPRAERLHRALVTFKLSDGAPLQHGGDRRRAHARREAGQVLPARRRGAVRVPRRLLEVQAGTTDRPAQRQREPNNVDYDHTNKVMRFVVDPAADGPDQPWDPATDTGDKTTAALPDDAGRQRGDEPDPGAGGEDPADARERARRSGSSTARPGTTSRPAASGCWSTTPPQPDDVETVDDREQARRLVPPDAHPPGGLPDRRPERPGPVRARRRARRTSSTWGRTRRSSCW